MTHLLSDISLCMNLCRHLPSGVSGYLIDTSHKAQRTNYLVARQDITLVKMLQTCVPRDMPKT